MKDVWFVTGSSRGFGRALVRAALKAGHGVVATARDPAQLDCLVEEFGEQILPVELDVTSPAMATAAITAGVDRFGRVDIVVNNAGYANIAPIETGSEADFRRQFETNFWGVYNVSKAALPLLRRQGTGTIVQFSSIGGRVGGTAGLGSYQAAKFAVDGFTRVLAAETEITGLRYLVVEPGGFATDWAGASMGYDRVPAEYADTVGATARMLAGGNAAGDPARAAEIIMKVVARRDMPPHLVLGEGAARSAIGHAEAGLEETRRWRNVSTSADAGRPYPVEMPDETAP